jgi:hypothetical protein
MRELSTGEKFLHHWEADTPNGAVKISLRDGGYAFGRWYSIVYPDTDKHYEADTLREVREEIQDYIDSFGDVGQ